VSVQLQPGANTALPTSSLRIELSWAHTTTADADVSGLLCTGRRVRSDADFVFYNQPSDLAGVLRHAGKLGDPTPGSAVTDVLEVDLAGLAAGVDLLVIAASLDAAPGFGFGDLSEAGLTLTVRAASDGSALVIVPLADLSAQRALVVAEVYRRDGGWKVRAVAQGYDDGLAGLARDFGVDVDEEVQGEGPTSPDPSSPPEPAAPPAASGAEESVPALAEPRTGPSWDWRDPPVPAGYRS